MKRWVGLAAILLLLPLTAGCPYTSKEPLGVPDHNSFDPRLVGLWMGVDNDGDSTLIRVLPFNEAEYYVETEEQDKEPSRYRLFVFKVGDEQLLHFNELARDGAAPEYSFARYAFSASGELSMRFVGDKIVPKALATDPKSLKAFLASHLNDPALDDQDVKLVLRRR